ncbi:MAG: tetratricopeptide repeat protein, partial [Myxococcales bacterium]|nr:tetratricopeptide repeat protein [Myxococcales bacterium]
LNAGQLQLSVDLDPGAFFAQLNLGRLLARSGRLKEAERCYRAATEIAPKHPDGWYNRGLLKRRMGDMAAALGFFEEARALDPQDPEIALALLYAASATGDRPRVLRVLSDERWLESASSKQRAERDRLRDEAASSDAQGLGVR